MTETSPRPSAEPDAAPCPFCGSQDISTHQGSTFRWLVAECNSCGALGPEVRRTAVADGLREQWDAKGRQRALNEWNMRKGPAK